VSTPAKRPLITANQVTLARLIPMPLLSWWVYQGQRPGQTSYLWWALIVGTLIGCTDFVDGLIARKYGPTVLGGLLNPIADKVFIAFAYVPFADVGMIPPWACALMFMREFFVTALRSAYEQRNLTLKTSYLGKAKTWTQMQGIGVLLLFPLVDNQAILTGIILFGLVTPLVAMAALWLIKKKFWRGALAMSATFAALLAVHLQHDMALTMRVIMFGIVAITWISGADYIVIGWKQLRGRGDFSRADGVRLVGALTMPALAFAILVRTDAPAWPIFAILAAELAVGGLDNLLSHHHQASPALPWGARVLGVSALLGAALLLPASAGPLAIVAGVASMLGVAWEFWRGKDYYMDARIRNKALKEAASA
jgi:CDP-diacylglycerol--glycerol-3-phosphate 3-phosphatidyltransferase